MSTFKKASLVVNEMNVGELFNLNFHYKTYKFKTIMSYCLLVSINNNTAQFLIQDKMLYLDLNDEDIILYAKPSF